MHFDPEFVKVAPVKKVRKNGTSSVVRIAMSTRNLRVILAVSLLVTSLFSQSTHAKTGTLQGLVFTRDADGARAIVPGAKISLTGAATLETDADAAGEFVFTGLAPGSYTLKAQAPGMIAIQTIDVTAAETAGWIARMYEKWGKPQQASKWRQKAEAEK